MFYVYKHTDLATKEIVYVGKGSGGRAWQCGTSHSPLRAKVHCAWADAWLDLGATPDEWVEIINRGLSKKKALEIENLLIHELKPKFNMHIRSKCLKFTPEIYQESLLLRERGFSYKAIGEEVGLSAMVIHRGLNKMPISLEVLLAGK